MCTLPHTRTLPHTHAQTAARETCMHVEGRMTKAENARIMHILEL